MQYLVSSIISTCTFSRSFILFFALVCLISLDISSVDAQSKAPASPEKEIVVKDYKWGSGGSGTVGIIKEITLENKGKTDYKDIDIEVDLYTASDVPLGSLRSTIHEELSGGSQKTFYNVNLGFMHSELQKSVIRVVGAKPVDTLGQPKDLIIVKKWEWSGGLYSTEGILKEITLENKSGTNYKNIEIQLDYFGGGGTKLGPTRAVIHDVLPAKSEKTFYGINVGFRHPETSKTLVTVIDAVRAPVKKPKPSVAKKGGVLDKYKKKAGAKEEDKKAVDTTGEQTQVAHLSEKTGTAKTPQTRLALGVTKGAPQANDITEPSDKGSLSEKEIGSRPHQRGGAPDIGVPEEEYEEEPIPQDDIVVKDFKWGGNVTGTLGTFRELILENQSGITYTKIELMVDFYGITERRPLGSYRVTIYDVLPANSEKVFRDVKVGYVNVIPGDIQVRIIGALAVRQ